MDDYINVHVALHVEEGMETVPTEIQCKPEKVRYKIGFSFILVLSNFLHNSSLKLNNFTKKARWFGEGRPGHCEN